MRKPWKLKKEEILDALKKHPLISFCKFSARESSKNYDFKGLLGFDYESHEVTVHLDKHDCEIATRREFLDKADAILTLAGFKVAERGHVFYLSESRVW